MKIIKLNLKVVEVKQNANSEVVGSNTDTVYWMDPKADATIHVHQKKLKVANEAQKTFYLHLLLKFDNFTFFLFSV